MSADASGWVFRYSPCSGVDLAVHLAIADSANDQHGYEFFMSMSNLAKKARCSRRTAGRAVDRLVQGGLLEMLDERKGRASLYVMLFPELPVVFETKPRRGASGVRTPKPAPTPEPMGEPASAVRRGCEHLTQGVRTGDAQTQEEPKGEPKVPPPTPPQAGGEHEAGGSVDAAPAQPSEPDPIPEPAPPPGDPEQPEPPTLTLLEPPTALAVLDPTPTFADFYEVWPRRVKKGEAERAWAKAMKAGADPTVILAAAERIAAAYATVQERGSPAERSQCDQFTPYPASWLNAAGWDDDPYAMAAFQRFVARARGFSPPMNRQEQAANLGAEVEAKLRAEAMRGRMRRTHSDTLQVAEPAQERHR